MTYNNFLEFWNALCTHVIVTSVKDVAVASFHLTKNGNVKMEIDVTDPLNEYTITCSYRQEVRPSLAWCIFQLLSTLKALQQR
jgi:hypothetical protein